MLLLVNRVPAVFSSADVRTRVERVYDCEVAAVLPHSDEMMVLASSGIYALRYPDHEVTAQLRQIAEHLIG